MGAPQRKEFGREDSRAKTPAEVLAQKRWHNVDKLALPFDACTATKVTDMQRRPEYVEGEDMAGKRTTVDITVYAPYSKAASQADTDRRGDSGLKWVSIQGKAAVLDSEHPGEYTAADTVPYEKHEWAAQNGSDNVRVYPRNDVPVGTQMSVYLQSDLDAQGSAGEWYPVEGVTPCTTLELVHTEHGTEWQQAQQQASLEPVITVGPSFKQ